MADRSKIDTGTGELLAEIRDRVAILTLNRPEARNALSDHLTPALRRMINHFGDDAGVGVILITGAGTAFCAGGDVKGMGQSTKGGPAAGAGLALALVCDIRIAAQSAILTTGYARIGLSGDYGIAWLLTRLAGFSRARELMFLSERVDAQRAEALGLVNRVVPDAELRQTAFALAASLAEGPAIAFGHMKDNLDHAMMS